MSRTHFICSVAVVLATLVTAGPVRAQSVQWRHDYAAARKEAAETGRQLLLDFGTEACVWCRKLDATTFRDPKVIKLLNERFVPVKLDGNKEQQLTAALRIDGFPTLVLATPDGKVFGRHAGYVDSAQFLALANKAPESPAPRRQNADPVAPNEAPSRQIKAQIDADLAALYPGIAAALAP